MPIDSFSGQRFVVAATDPDWFSYLRARPEIEEVNFWRPGAASTVLPTGTIWFYVLRGTASIVGCGVFLSYSQLPVSVAWNTFGQANGFADHETFRARIANLQRMPERDVREIGCAILGTPLYFADPVEYDKRRYGPIEYHLTTEAAGRELWDRLNVQLAAAPNRLSFLRPLRGGFGAPTLVTPRLGQNSFKIAVTAAYQRRCTITGEKTLPALEAAHIKPFSLVGEHSLDNGLLLRADLHKLFDDGYVSVQPDLTFRVSKAIRDEFENGRDYYILDGRRLRDPVTTDAAPRHEYLDWHYSTQFKG
jgi:putative restriction endonuclease